MAHRWIKHIKQTGLAAVGALPRGAVMTDTITGEMYMGLYPLDRSGSQWKYIIYRSSGNLSSKAIFASYDEAKVAADARWKAGKEQLIALRNETPEEKNAKKLMF